MARFNLADYETVEERLRRFWKDHPNGAIITQNQTTEGDRERKQWVVYAEVYFNHDDIRPRGTGMAFETDGVGMAQTTAAMETCESSSIGRALANCGYSGNKRASRTEMEKVQRGTVTPIGIEKIDPSKATTLDELNALWQQAVLFGSSGELQAEFTAKKKELGG